MLELVRLNVTPQFDAISDKEEKDAELGRGKLGGRRKAIFLTAGLTLLFILRLTYRKCRCIDCLHMTSPSVADTHVHMFQHNQRFKRRVGWV